jgi:hypothetical protein
MINTRATFARVLLTILEVLLKLRVELSQIVVKASGPSELCGTKHAGELTCQRANRSQMIYQLVANAIPVERVRVIGHGPKPTSCHRGAGKASRIVQIF